MKNLDLVSFCVIFLFSPGGAGIIVAVFRFTKKRLGATASKCDLNLGKCLFKIIITVFRVYIENINMKILVHFQWIEFDQLANVEFYILNH